MCGVPAPRPIVLLRLLNLALGARLSLSPLFSIPRVGLELLPLSPEALFRTRTRSPCRPTGYLPHCSIPPPSRFRPILFFRSLTHSPNVGCHAREIRNLARTLLCQPPSHALIVLRPIPRSVCFILTSALSHSISRRILYPPAEIPRQLHVALYRRLRGGFFPRLGRQMTTVAAKQENW